jgi:hypothetical protein
MVMKSTSLKAALFACAFALASVATLFPGSAAAQDNVPPLLEEIANKRVAADPLGVSSFVAETKQFDAVASDPNLGDVLTYSLPVLVSPSGNAVRLTDLGVTISNATDADGRPVGRITIAPGPEDVGVWQLTVRVDDGQGSSDVQNVFISVGTFTNQSPVFALLPPAEVVAEEGSPITFSMTASDPDTSQSVSLTSAGMPAGAGFPDGTSGNPVSATFSWTPAMGQAGDYTLFFDARDNGAPTISESVRTIIRVVVATCPAAPRIISLTPNQGSPSGGTLVTLEGQGFCAPVAVTVGGRPVTNLTVISPVQLTFQTPPGTEGQAADVTVMAAGGDATLSGGFLYSGQVAVEPFAALTATLEIDRGPGAADDVFEVKASFTLGAGSDGIDPLTEAVTLQLGSFSLTIPAGAFRSDKRGRFKLEGLLGTMLLEAQFRPLGGGAFEFKAEGSGADLSALANPVTIGLTIGNDGGSRPVTAEFE